MCLVEVEGMRGLQISCATPVADGMVVHTVSDAVKTAQDGVLEFLLINHPLDCPVCDRGGECPLQDQTLAFGPGESRFVEEKRHFEKPVPISDLVLLDRERCIQCGRCTRFAAEVAGDPLIDFGGRGGETEVITYPDEPFHSPFSGNTVQICPVGALTARPYRFRARPWDLTSTETSCRACAVGCRGSLESASNRLVRLLGVDADPVNQGWLCDKGRYGLDWVHSDDRLRQPLSRRAGELVETSWPDALDAAATAIKNTLDTHGPGGVAVLGGARGVNEDAYLWARLAKGVLRTDHVDAQLGDGLPADVVLGMPRATIPDLDRARAIVLLGADLKAELPVLYLRVRRAAVDLGVPLVDVAGRDHGLTPYATAVVRHPPGDPGEAAALVADALQGRGGRSKAGKAVVDAVGDRPGPVVVVVGRPSVAEQPDAVIDAAARLAAVPDVRFLSALRTANVHGALDLGLAPGFLPGRVTLDAGRDHFAAAWGAVPDTAGHDAAGILHAAATGEIATLVLVDCDPLAEFPDRRLARDALAQATTVIAVTSFLHPTAADATVVLPPTVWGEQRASSTNLEGRVQRLGPRVTPEGSTLESWRIPIELASRLGSDFDLETVDEVQDEIARVAPAFAGVDATLLRRARDGVVIPLADHPDDVIFVRAPAGHRPSWEPIQPAPEIVADDAGNGAHPDPPPTVSPPTPPVPLHQWDGTSEPPSVTPLDAYALRLVSGHALYGADPVVTDTPTLAPLVRPATLGLHARDRDRLGVHDGDRVRVSTARGSVDLDVRTDPDTLPGTAWIAANAPGPGAPDLIDATTPITELRVETIP